MQNDVGLLNDVWFAPDDQFLFFVDDLDLRANALRYSILPKLRLLIHEAIAAVRAIYEIDVLADSHIQESPNFRGKRNTDLNTDYQWATVGISGKRSKDKWHGFTRKDGKMAQIVPFKYEMGFTAEGLGIRLDNYWLKGLSNSSYEALLDIHIQHADIIHPLCYRSGIMPLLHWGKGCPPFSTFTQHYTWMRDHRRFDNDFYSKSLETPLTTDMILNVLESFVVFFPVYDSYIQIAKGLPPRIDALCAHLSDYYLAHIGEESIYRIVQEPNAAVFLDSTFLTKAREMAAERVPVMSALRYQVFKRDHFQCVACGRRGGDESVILHLDHILPRSKGGQDTLDNLQTLCSTCNLGKGNRDDTDLRRSIE